MAEGEPIVRSNDIMRRAGSGALLGVWLLAAPAWAAAPDPVERFDVAGWTGAAFVDQARRFSHCAIWASFGAATLSFVQGPQGDFRIEIVADDWHMTPGSDHVATLTVDRAPPIQVIGVAEAPSLLAIDVGQDDELVRVIRAGQYLRVIAEEIGLSFSLGGTAEALPRLRRCVADGSLAWPGR